MEAMEAGVSAKRTGRGRCVLRVNRFVCVCVYVRARRTGVCEC